MRRIASSIVLLALVGAFLFSLEGCGDEPNPCKGRKTISADFIMGEQFLAIDTLIDADTVLSGGPLSFKSKGEYASYEWTIGEDPRQFTTRTVSLLFNSVGSPKTIFVKLKVQDPFLKSCFPSTHGIDSVIRKLVILPSDASAVFGRYEGSLEEDPTNKYVVTISYCNPITKSFICTNNIDKGCDNKLYTSDPYPYINDFDFTYRALKVGGKDSFNFFNSSTSYPNLNCNDPNGWLYFGKSLNDVVIEYTTAIYPNTKKRISHKFTGKRLK